MMKKYKVVKLDSAEAFEIALNGLANEGWKVISANMAYSDPQNNEVTYFALLVMNDIDVELKQLMEENTNALEDIDLNPSPN
jgi:hypothetical protein